MFRKVLNRAYTFQFAQAKPSFLSVTEAAKERLRQIVSKSQNEQIIGLKVSLTKKGCNGLSYKMEYAKSADVHKFDEVIETEGIKVVVDSKALMAIVGAELDFVQNQLGKQFVFNNPNEKGRCGCGESFHL